MRLTLRKFLAHGDRDVRRVGGKTSGRNDDRYAMCASSGIGYAWRHQATLRDKSIPEVAHETLEFQGSLAQNNSTFGIVRSFLVALTGA